MIRYTCFIVPPVRTKKATNTDRLSLRISYTLRLYPKAQQLSLPIYREDEAAAVASSPAWQKETRSFLPPNHSSYRMLFLDGVYAEDRQGVWRFFRVKAPSQAELVALAHRLSHRVEALVCMPVFAPKPTSGTNSNNAVATSRVPLFRKSGCH